MGPVQGYQYDSDFEGDDDVDNVEDDPDGEVRVDTRLAQQMQVLGGEGVFMSLLPENLEEILTMADSGPVEDGAQERSGMVDDGGQPALTFQYLFRLIGVGVVMPALNMV